jgi:DNA primase
MLSPVDQIKDRLSIADVVSSYLKLERAGQNFRARCPFHNEKTPSFFVSPARGSYHCFGCNRGGDIFTFVEDIEGASFAEALKTLADRAGVKLTQAGNKEREENKRSYDLLEAATKFYESNLLRSSAVKDYVKGRGLKEDTVRSFRLGFAPDGWSNLYEYLKSKGFQDGLMEENGLVIKGNRGLYDRFRSRIMFPLSDSQGRVVGFSGRIFNGDEKEAKYVNSPETPLYNKSKILYGYDKAKREMLKENFCVIVEGQMDLLMAHQAGTANAVAVSGTALTEEHIRLIKRFTETILLSFDADAAGLKAGERGVGLALASGMDVKMVKLPAGLDPADIILKDQAVWKEALKSAKHIVDFLLDYFKEKKADDRSYRLEVGKHVLPYVADISSSIDRGHFIKKIASALSLPEEDIRAEVEKAIKNKEKEKKGQKPEEAKAAPAVRSQKTTIGEKIIGLYLWQSGLAKPSADLGKFKNYDRIAGIKIEEEAGRLSDGQKSDLIFQAEMYYPEEKAIAAELEELLNNFEKESLEEKLGALMGKLRSAETENDEKEAEAALKECHELTKRINEIKNSRFLEK